MYATQDYYRLQKMHLGWQASVCANPVVSVQVSRSHQIPARDRLHDSGEGASVLYDHVAAIFLEYSHLQGQDRTVSPVSFSGNIAAYC